MSTLKDRRAQATKAAVARNRLFGHKNVDGRTWGGTPTRGAIAIPENAPPLVRRLLEEANRQQTTIVELAAASGVNADTISNWRSRHQPTVANFEACLNALGFKLAIVPEGWKL